MTKLTSRNNLTSGRVFIFLYFYQNIPEVFLHFSIFLWRRTWDWDMRNVFLVDDFRWFDKSLQCGMLIRFTSFWNEMGWLTEPLHIYISFVLKLLFLFHLFFLATIFLLFIFFYFLFIIFIQQKQTESLL